MFRFNILRVASRRRVTQLIEGMSLPVLRTVSKAVAVAALTLASSAALAHVVPVPAHTGPIGEAVDNIRFARLIDSFSALDNRRVVLTKSQNQHYLLHLKRDCTHLLYTQHVGFSSQMGTVRAGWDVLLVQGQNCAIQRIDRLSRAEFDAVRGVRRIP